VTGGPTGLQKVSLRRIKLKCGGMLKEGHRDSSLKPDVGIFFRERTWLKPLAVVGYKEGGAGNKMNDLWKVGTVKRVKEDGGRVKEQKGEIERRCKGTSNWCLVIKGIEGSVHIGLQRFPRWVSGEGSKAWKKKKKKEKKGKGNGCGDGK